MFNLIRKPGLALTIFLMLTTICQVFDPVEATAAGYTLPSSNRMITRLNNGWKFKYGVDGSSVPYEDSSWGTVNLPHTWNNLDGQDGGNNYKRGVGWYRKSIHITSALAGRKFYLEFKGANSVAEVWINNKKLGTHQGGYSAFRFDATPYIWFDSSNIIAVRVNNAHNDNIAPLSADFTFFGGIYRDVNLIITDKLAIDMLDFGSSGVYLKPTNVTSTSANLEVTAKIANAHPSPKIATITTIIVDANGEIVQNTITQQTIAANGKANVVQNMAVGNPRLWNGLADPYLYKAYVEIWDGGTLTDVTEQSFGFRSFNIDPAKGFFLNGQYLDLHGVNRHQDRADKGWAIGKAEHEQDMALIKEMGATAIRLAHYQHDDYFYTLADKTGMLIWAEIPLVNKITETPEFYANAKQQMTELIRQNYNHPSIFFWGIGNEIELEAGPNPNTLLAQLHSLSKQEDTTRLTTYASCCRPPTQPSTKHTDVIGFNEYWGWYANQSSGFGSWADAAHAAQPNRAMAISEYGAGASVYHHIQNAAKPIHDGDLHPEEYQALLHEEHWKAMKTRPYLWGKFLWNMFDFASDKRAEGDNAGLNDKGLVTYDRQIKKDTFYWYKANWSNEPTLHITSRRDTHRTNPVTSVKVYSNLDGVELKLNGVSLGVKTSDDRIFRWDNLTLQEGHNTVEVIGRRGSTTLTDSTRWFLSSNSFRINAGGKEPYTDVAGRYFAEDMFYSEGVAGSIKENIANTEDDAMIGRYREGNFRYNIPLPNGTYQVSLQFVEPYWLGSGKRSFNVKAEGATVISNLDIYAQAGRYNYLEKIVTVAVTDSWLNLEFVPSVDKAIVSAIAIKQNNTFRRVKLR